MVEDSQQRDAGNDSVEPPIETVGQPPSPEILAARQQEVERLLLDTHIIVEGFPPPNFHPDTGEDLRNNPVRATEVQIASLEKIAIRETSRVLGYAPEARFSPKTGKLIPPADAIHDRLQFNRGEMGFLVSDAEKRGINVPRFDSQTGKPLPPDSLRVYEAVFGRKQNPPNDIPTMEQELDLGLKALSAMKNLRLQDEVARRKAGLPPSR